MIESLNATLQRLAQQSRFALQRKGRAVALSFNSGIRGPILRPAASFAGRFRACWRRPEACFRKANRNAAGGEKAMSAAPAPGQFVV